jgi:TPR repeat protein
MTRLALAASIALALLAVQPAQAQQKGPLPPGLIPGAEGCGLATEEEKKILSGGKRYTGTPEAVAPGQVPTGPVRERTPEQEKVEREVLQRGVDKGDACSQDALGSAYLSGQLGLKVDRDKAFELTKKAADQGFNHAMSNLAVLYMEGIGVDRNYEEGTKWYEKAMASGDMKAARYIATNVELGIGTKINYKRAAELYRIAADRGDITGQCMLGSLYERGLGVPQSYDEAEKWYTISAGRGDLIASPGYSALGNLYETRQDGKANLQTAIDWYRKGAVQGNPEAQANLLRMTFSRPHATTPGRNVCLSILKLVSAINSDPVYERAQSNALFADQTLQEAKKAAAAGKSDLQLKYLQQAADLGYAPAQAQLGQAYLAGKIVKADAKKGQALIKAATDQGYSLPQ